MGLYFILQGVPGSGKTTLANTLLLLPDSVSHSTDSYFYENGEYKFDKKKLQHNHKLNFLAAEQSCIVNKKVIIIDNCNILIDHAMPYIAQACKYNYSVSIIRVNGEFTNTHNVPEHKVVEMKMKMQQLFVPTAFYGRSLYDNAEKYFNKVN